jgi:predicted RNA binding protein YcfA (HicA-like mRNA interferase family)
VRRSLRDIRQEEALRAFVRLGGVERRGKGSHRVVNLGGMNLSLPHGILKEGLLRHLIKAAGLTVEEFIEAL